jgi:hypothetical protein
VVKLRERLENDRDLVSEMLAVVVQRSSEAENRRLLLRIRRDLFNLRTPPPVFVEHALRALTTSEADHLHSFVRQLNCYKEITVEGEKVLENERENREMTAAALMRSSMPFLRAIAFSSPTLHHNLIRYFARIDQQQPRDKTDRRAAQKGLLYILRATTKAGAWTWFAGVDLGLHQSSSSHLSSVRVNEAFAELERLNVANGEWKGKLALNPYLWSDERCIIVVHARIWSGDSRCVVPRELQVTRLPRSRSIDLVIELLQSNGGVTARERLEDALAAAVGDSQKVTKAMVRRFTGRLVDAGVLLPGSFSCDSSHSSALSAVARREGIHQWHKLDTTGRAQMVAACTAHTVRVIADSTIRAQNMGPPLYEQVFCAHDSSFSADTRLLHDCFSLRPLLPLLDEQTLVRCVMTDLFVAQHGTGGCTSDVLAWLFAWRKTCGSFADSAVMRGVPMDGLDVGERGVEFFAAYDRFVSDRLQRAADMDGEVEIGTNSFDELPPSCQPAIDCWAFHFSLLLTTIGSSRLFSSS